VVDTFELIAINGISSFKGMMIAIEELRIAKHLKWKASVDCSSFPPQKRLFHH